MTQRNQVDPIADICLQMKTHLENSKNEANQLEGQQKQILNQFNTDFGCGTLAEAIAFEQEVLNQITSLDRELVSDALSLVNELGWEAPPELLALNHGSTAALPGVGDNQTACPGKITG